ncbi:MAG: glycine zipper domain-containing protein [Deferrisomatales bacterium]|nr:glycine zipper domain-containing protein [Deferrisomatales bacterium]
MFGSTRHKRVLLVALGVALAMPLAAGWAQELVIYPAKGQDQVQQDKDKVECYNWAKGQSGFDPMALPTASSPPPQQEAPKGGLLKGAARGALVGVAVGAIAGDAGKGAAIGAAGGGLVGGMRKKDQAAQQAQAQQQWEQQQAAEYAQKRGAYNRNFSACMEGRGYTVK